MSEMQTPEDFLFDQTEINKNVVVILSVGPAGAKVWHPENLDPAMVVEAFHNGLVKPEPL
jgi:hypothetical protein